MIIGESGLLRAMKEAYKSGGYHVATEIDEGGYVNLIITTATWAIVAKKKAMSRKVLALLVEHLGELPKPGQAFQVKKKEPQTEIFEVIQKSVRSFHEEGDSIRIMNRTDLTLGGSRLWQRKEDRRIFKINPALEAIMLIAYGTVHIIEDDRVMMRDTESRVYVSVEATEGHEQERLDHLAKIQWA